ncbi:PREDICTED: 28S ribosomal protein S30, mitochondrial [Wasmannia auropunctata]|uniref:28S ribosomal protein S30, mitochondrial n=1 Tax=Wasmannia auropunctata TaxID=64793 RepID=UPI0005EDE77B|nr:PREDICTED: 28S ribosomal protein S30, mitochondrial [Wasmannia auropunctata]XP_011694127.1 PREDICTED: 28S ribosomal protein S30, mitochondrial [Wasmannia auropunctata]
MFANIRQRLLINTVVKCGKQKRYSISAVSEVKNETEVAVEPIYPPIQDISWKAEWKRKRQAWHDKIKGLETVEEKLFEINMPRYYGWKSLILQEHTIPYDSLSHAQYYTRTHIVKESGLPAYYNSVTSNEQLERMVQAIKSDIEDNIIFEYCIRRREHEMEADKIPLDENITAVDRKIQMEDVISKALIHRINRTMLIHFASENPHLFNAEIDFEPRLEASWFMGGLNPPNFVKNFRKIVPFLKDYVDDSVNLPVYYTGKPVVHLRYKHPLREIMPLSDCENSALDVPSFKMNPKVLNYFLEKKHLTNIPGFWPGDESEFGFLSYHNCTYLHRRENYNDTPTALTVQAVLASYSWLLSQACYQGFSTFNDITYPLTTQTVITNGQWWSFFVYQLNTTLVHSEYADENPKRNICWVTEPMKLFDKIEDEKVHGLNEEVLKNLIKFYMNVPEERVGVNLKPYLGKTVKVIADIEHDERRNWLEKHYKHLVTNRPRHRRIPEIYDWQKIYKILHKTRPMDKKREPWEHGIRMYKRRLDDHQPPYIPRFLRDRSSKKRGKGRWAKTYYP